MAFPKRQNTLDWLTQFWNICLGRKSDAVQDEWLVDPIGRPSESPEEFIKRLASENQLTVRRNTPDSGLLWRFKDWGVPVEPCVSEFYHRTIDYTFEASSYWEPFFGVFGLLVSNLFSRRVQQFNLPSLKPHETVDFDSEIIQLVDAREKVIYTVWLRSIKNTGEMVFYGIYSTCLLPSGAYGIKSVFPLPQGNATVVFEFGIDSNGRFELVSSGKKYGDPGFYFIVEDSRGVLWKHFLPSLRQKITVYSSENSELVAEHTMKMWKFKVYRMSYMIRKVNGEAS